MERIMQMLKRKSLLLVIVVVIAMLGAFSAATVSAQDDETVIGAILFAQDSFFQSIQAGMEQAAEDAGVTLLVNIHDHDIAAETALIEDYIARGVDAIVITPESLDASVPALQAAADAGVTIVCFNTCVNQEAQDAFVSAFYETDQASLGYQTGEYLAMFLGDNGITDVNIGISQCDFVEACQRRGAGFRQALADAGVTYNEVANQEGYQPDVAASVGETMLQANPQINILWAENEGGTVGLTLAVQSMGLAGQVYVFGTDISDQLATMLLAEDNILQAVTGQSPEIMGSSAVNAAIEVVNGGEPAGYHIVDNAFFSRSEPADVEAFLAGEEATPEATAEATEASS
jgi:ABC-type sugar transport system substrate-binding protein